MGRTIQEDDDNEEEEDNDNDNNEEIGQIGKEKKRKRI